MRMIKIEKEGSPFHPAARSFFVLSIRPSLQNDAGEKRGVL